MFLFFRDFSSINRASEKSAIRERNSLILEQVDPNPLVCTRQKVIKERLYFNLISLEF